MDVWSSGHRNRETLANHTLTQVSRWTTQNRAEASSDDYEEMNLSLRRTSLESGTLTRASHRLSSQHYPLLREPTDTRGASEAVVGENTLRNGEQRFAAVPLLPSSSW